jgi:putative oxidoreductase
MSYGLLLLRVVVGGTMCGHGAQKLFGWFGGGGPKAPPASSASSASARRSYSPCLRGLGESGGLLFAAGFLTPLAALGMAIVMLNAISTVHWSKGFWNGNGGIEFR